MNIVRNIFIFITASLHVLFFKLESIDFMKPETLLKFRLTPETAAHVEAWAFNQGFYNLFLAIGLFFTLFLIYKKDLIKAKILGSFILLTIIGAGCVLYFSVPGSIISAVTQALPALIAFILLRISPVTK